MTTASLILLPLRKAIEMHRAGQMSEADLMLLSIATMEELERAGLRPEVPEGPVAHYLSLMEAPVA